MIDVVCLALCAAATPAEAVVVVVEVEADVQVEGISAAAIMEALSAHLGELGFTVQSTRPDPPRAVAEISVSRTDAGDLRLQVSPPDASEPLVREIPDTGDPDLLLETLGVIARGMLAPPVEPEPEPPPPEPAPQPSPQPVSTPPRTSGLDLGLSYRGETFAREQLWHSGLRLGLGWESPGGAVVELAGAWVPPHRMDSSVSVQRIPLDVSAGWRARPRRRVRPMVFGLATVEALGWSGAWAGARARPGWAPRVGLGAGAGLQVESRGWRLSVRQARGPRVAPGRGAGGRRRAGAAAAGAGIRRLGRDPRRRRVSPFLHPKSEAKRHAIHGGPLTSLSPERQAERELCRRVAARDRAAAQTLAKTLMPTVRNVAHRLTRTASDAEDATQVGLLEILRSAGNFRGDGSLHGWAGRIAMRSIARWCARTAKSSHEELPEEERPGTALSTLVVDALPRPLGAYLDELPEPQRTALVLRHSFDCTVPEIAEMTESPLPTVKSRLSKALERIRGAVRRDVRFGRREVGA